jgi:deoxyribonuclease-4
MPSALGRHMPLESHPVRALQTARAIGCDAVQIFVSSPRVWASPAINPKETAALAEALRGFAPVVIHAAYLINIASSNPETRAKSLRLLHWTLERGTVLGATDVVFHIGSHGGDGVDAGIERLVTGLRAIARDLPPGPRLLLENDVGAGHTIGADFAAIARVLAEARDAWGDRLGVCIDTAHLWGAGYDISTPEAVQATLARIDTTVGLDQVWIIHLNDTTTALGGHRDLHARLGEGIIGAEGLRALLSDPRLAHAGVILETPIKLRVGTEEHDWDDDRARIAYARLLTNSPQNSAI